MKKLIFSILCCMLIGTNVWGQTVVSSKPTVHKKSNLTIKEYNSDADGKRRWLDHVTTYNSDGNKIEEIEYASYGMKERTVYEYNTDKKCIKETLYNDKNKVQRVRKYTYDNQGRKKEQYNYLANGKLFSIKRFEYIVAAE